MSANVNLVAPTLLTEEAWPGPKKPPPAYMKIHERWSHGHVLGTISEDTHDDHPFTWMTTVYAKNEHGHFVGVEIEAHEDAGTRGIDSIRRELFIKLQNHHARIEQELATKTSTSTPKETR